MAAANNPGMRHPPGYSHTGNGFRAIRVDDGVSVT